MDQILGREAEFAVLAETLSGAVNGSPRFLVLEGPPSIGKSALLASASAFAEDAGARVLPAAASAGESDFALGVAGQLFDLALDGDPDERRAWLRGPAGLVPQLLNPDAREAPPDPSESGNGHAASRALYWLTVNIVRRAPLVIVIDDIQWADAASLRWLIHLSRRMHMLPLAVITALSTEVPATDAALMAHLLSGVDRMQLSGLDAESVARLIAERFGTPPSIEFARQCQAATGGKPLLLHHLLQTLTGAGMQSEAAAASHVQGCGSRQLGETILLRLSQSSADVVRLAASVALLGHAELETAAAAAGLPLATAVSVARALVRMDVLTLGEKVAVRHDLVRNSILAALHEGETEQLHARTARALFERCAPATTVAAHLVRTATPVGEDWAAQALWAAAQAALGEGRPERALASLRRLLAEPHQPLARASYLAELGAVEVYEHLPAAVEHLRAALSRLDDPALVAPLACRLAGALLDLAAPGEAVAVLAEAMERVAPRDPGLADELDLQRLSVISWSGASGPEFGEDLDGLLERVGGRAAGRLGPLADALSALRLGASTSGSPAARVLAIAALDGIAARTDLGEDQLVAGLGNIAAALHRAQEHRLVIDYCQRHAVDADRRGLRLLAAWMGALRAATHQAVGEHAQAEAHARAALEASVCVQGGPRRLATVLATAVLADWHAEQGQERQGLTLLADARLDGDLPGLWVYDHALLARGRLRLAAGEAAVALTDLIESGRRAEAGPGGGLVAARWRCAAAVAYTVLGRRSEAVTLAAEQVAQARARGARFALAQALTVHGILAPRRRALREAVDLLAQPGFAAGDDLVRTALDLLRRRGDRWLAGQLERLVDVLQVVPAPRHEMHPPGRRPAFGPAALTAHERRLIEMAVAGQTNEAIAEQFGVSRRAVEFHFTQIYRKLGISRRLQLHEFAVLAAHA